MAYRKVKRLLLLLLVVILLVLLHSLLSLYHRCDPISSFCTDSNGIAILKKGRQDTFDSKNYDRSSWTARNRSSIKTGDSESDICSDDILSKDLYYRELMNTYLDAWYKFVPHQSKMDSSNCWYVKNFNSLPKNMTDKMIKIHDFQNLPERFPRADIDRIFKMIMADQENSAVFTTQPSHHHFCLPKYDLIGFSKAGSTFLHEYIRSHPLFAEPYNKEGLFWREVVSIKDPKYIKLAVLLYLYHFLDASTQIKDQPNMFTVDASVSTIFATSKPLKIPEIDVCIVPLMLYKTMPKTKLVVLMRNPIDRLWSDFLYFCPPSKWDAHESLKELTKSPQVVASLFHNYTVTALQDFHACIASDHTLIHCTTLAGSYPGISVGCEKVRPGISLYYVHLIKWFNVFPREQLHVLRLEDLVSDPISTMTDVWTFIGKPFEGIRAIERKVNPNLWAKASNGADFKMLPATRKLLKDFFHPYNTKLSELVADERYMWNEPTDL